MEVLVSGFKGKCNSSKTVLDMLDSIHITEKLYLTNSFKTSRKELEKVLKNKRYDLIISFGQKPNVESIYLEKKACYKGVELFTDYEYSDLIETLNSEGFLVKTSNNAGNYLCNHIYYQGLKFIENNDLNTKMIFIHIPSINNIKNVAFLSKVFSAYISNII